MQYGTNSGNSNQKNQCPFIIIIVRLGQEKTRRTRMNDWPEVHVTRDKTRGSDGYDETKHCKMTRPDTDRKDFPLALKIPRS